MSFAHTSTKYNLKHFLVCNTCNIQAPGKDWCILVNMWVAAKLHTVCVWSFLHGATTATQAYVCMISASITNPHPNTHTISYLSVKAMALVLSLNLKSTLRIGWILVAHNIESLWLATQYCHVCYSKLWFPLGTKLIMVNTLLPFSA